MRLLVLGGTAFLSREVCRVAGEAGHDVTALARGESGAAPEAVRFVRADRDDDNALREVAGQQWDAVVDVAREPGQVRRAVRDLAGVVDHYVFVSSINAYAPDAGGTDEQDTPLLPALDGERMGTMAGYGAAKVACEELVTHTFGADRSLLVRAGLIGGPGDETGRSAYWPWRFARAASSGSEVLTPDEPDQPVQLVDVRDLADFVVHAAQQRLGDVVDTVGPQRPLSEVLQTARTVAGHTGPVRAAPSAWLTGQGVAPWMGARSLPLWLGGDDTAYSMMRRSGQRARTAGLSTRPLAQTFIDELDSLSAPPLSGLGDQEHQDLLAELT